MMIMTEQVWVWGYGILGKGPRLETAAVPTMIPGTLFGDNLMGR